MNFLSKCFDEGIQLLNKKPTQDRKKVGQYLTPPTIGKFMAKQLGTLPKHTKLLDPGIGSGMLACAVIERAVEEQWPKKIHVTGYEIDDELIDCARNMLNQASHYARENGIEVTYHLSKEDFILVYLDEVGLGLFSDKENKNSRYYDAIIANPPYFKLRKGDFRAEKASTVLSGYTNIYTLFMGIGIDLLSEDGALCYIVPRSFCSGAYFDRFRKDLIRKSIPTAIHLFTSRQEAFSEDSVLQENIIVSLRRRKENENLPETITISTSKGINDLKDDPLGRNVPLSSFLSYFGNTPYFRLPTSEYDESILKAIDKWPGTLDRYGLAISTGRVVPFRAKRWLMDQEAVNDGKAVPLYWMHNVKPQCTQWPVLNGNKQPGISIDGDILLVPNSNYVLVRRFSAKEEPRRLVVAPFLEIDFPYDHVGFENHLNYIYKKNGKLSDEELRGLSALLGSSLIDRYFRITNGNTQVNAAEIRFLPLPPLDVITEIGREVHSESINENLYILNQIVQNILKKHRLLPIALPLITETRIKMNKIQEAQDILRTLGLPSKQQNEISALTLLVLAQLSENTPWNDVQQKSLGIHDILVEIQNRYDKQYAENTRESIRRQVIHQFIQAAIVIRNPDDPTLSTNSPKTHYGLSALFIKVIRTYGSDSWETAAKTFLEEKGALFDLYQKERDIHRVSLILETGEEYSLSPGAHNKLQANIINEFGPIFAPGATLLYVGDTESKTLHLESEILAELSLQITQHDKLPDVVLYDKDNKLLYLIEAVTSHGPVSHKRYVELEGILENSSAIRIYVSAFPNFKEFGRHMRDIAWDTEVWLADNPEHLIHYNGDKFLSAHT